MSAAVEERPEVASDESSQPPGRIVLDRSTCHRLEVARSSAALLEGLADTGAWDELDPVVAAHLRDHARRLAAFLGNARESSTLRDCEAEWMELRRIERRLEIGLDLLGEKKPAAAPTGKGNGKQLFYGDFTERKLSKSEVARARVRKREQKAAEASRTSGAGRRMFWYVAVGVLTVAASLVSVVLSGNTNVRSDAAPPEAFQPTAYLEDLQIFLPAVNSMVSNGTANVIVSREWLTKSSAERKEGAEAAHVFLSNRAVPRLILRWEDGTVVATGQKDESMEFHL